MRVRLLRDDRIGFQRFVRGAVEILADDIARALISAGSAESLDPAPLNNMAPTPLNNMAPPSAPRSHAGWLLRKLPEVS